MYNCGNKERHHPHKINQHRTCEGVPAGSYNATTVDRSHEHDGGGCYDCDCGASPLNTAPCTCPASYRWIGRETLEGVRIEQTTLRHQRFEGEVFGEMTQTKNGRFVTINVELDKNWEELAQHLNFDLMVWPEPAVNPAQFRLPQKDEDHIIRGEN
jgi:hypothetical protein